MKDKFIANTVLNVLFLEDSVQDFEIICDQLINVGYNLNISRVDKENEFESSLRNNKYDIILSDFSLPGFDAYGALRLRNEICPNAPFICVSGSIGEETAIDLLKLGAVDYVLKDRPDRLPFAIKRALDEAKEKETRLKAEKALLQSEENFRRSISESPFGIRIVSVNGETIYANKAFLDIFEFKDLEEYTGTPAKDQYTPESYVEHLDRKRKRDTGQDVFDYEFSIMRNNGEIRHVKVSRKEVLWNGVKHFQVINMDITEQRNAEEKLRKLSRAVEQSPEAICITNPDGIIEYVNPKILEVTGYSIKELMGENPRIFSSGEKPKEEYAQLWKTIKSGNIWSGELHNKKKNGELYWESAIISPILDNQGRITHFLGIKEDITAKKQMHIDLIAAKEKAEESERLKSAFLANMSHEIRTPLNSIIGFSELMTDPDYDPDQQFQFAKIINASGNNLLAIISDIMDISKIEAGQVQVKKQLYSVDQLMSNIKKEYCFKAIEKGIELIVDPSNLHEEFHIESDETKVRQILVNFVGNAIKFTKQGHIGIGFKITGDFVQFHVKDTGIGIPKEYHDKVFERFRQVESANTRKYGGNGLGLAISKSLVELLGGKIWMESEQDKGSTFYFTIPK